MKKFQTYMLLNYNFSSFVEAGWTGNLPQFKLLLVIFHSLSYDGVNCSALSSSAFVSSGSVDLGAGYMVVVTDRGGTGVSGTSEIFQVTEAPEVEASSPPTVDEHVVGGEGGAVGHMNTAIFATAVGVGERCSTAFLLYRCFAREVGE